MSGSRATFWPVFLLGALSLSLGYTWGRFLHVPAHTPEFDQRQPGVTLVDKELRTPSHASPVPPAVVPTVPRAVDSPAAEREPSRPNARLDEVADVVESLGNATPEEIARFPWDRRVRAAVDKLRALGGTSYPVDSLPPGVLADLLSSLLERTPEPLTRAQRTELERLAKDWEIHIDRQLDDLGDDALALERELSVVAATDDFLEDARSRLDDRQIAQLDSWTPETLEWPPILSPLTAASIARRELRREEIAGVRDEISGSLAREFGLDPADGDRYAAKLLAEIERLLAQPSERGEIVERAVALGEAQARLYRELLVHPAIDAAARRRLHAQRRWLVPTIAGE